jgi:hypothetical protein
MTGGVGKPGSADGVTLPVFRPRFIDAIALFLLSSNASSAEGPAGAVGMGGGGAAGGDAEAVGKVGFTDWLADCGSGRLTTGDRSLTRSRNGFLGADGTYEETGRSPGPLDGIGGLRLEIEDGS